MSSRWHRCPFAATRRTPVACNEPLSRRPDSHADHVAVGIIADRDRFFIARRPPNVHQGGKWEFPGGKVNAGEPVFTALQRELHEEVGIHVHDARSLMQVHHVYPAKKVLLDVWSVTAYAGTPHGREGQEARWAARGELLKLDFPEADLPIQRRLWLPALYAISDCTRYGRAAFLQRLERALAGGLRLLQLREPGMEQGAYVTLAHEVIALCHRYGTKVLVNADPAWVGPCGADGAHLNSQRLMRTHTRPLSQAHFVAASCHNETELAQAADIGADAVVLGPVAVTSSHPGAIPLGWTRFGQLCRNAAPAVYALGGMRPGDFPQARACGGQGLAMISGVWEAADVGSVVSACAATNSFC